MKLFLLLTLLITAFNTGLIWTIQLVHYPGFHRIGKEAYKPYQEFHMRRILLLVGPTMLIELILSLALLFLYTDQLPFFWHLISFALLGFIWLHTAFLASPIHGKLLAGYQQPKVNRLIQINWLRTTAWTLRLIILSWLLFSFWS